MSPLSSFKPFRVVIVSKPLIGKILKKNGGAKQTELPPIRDPGKSDRS